MFSYYFLFNNTVKTVTLGRFHFKPIFDVRKLKIFANSLFGPLQHQKWAPRLVKARMLLALIPPVPRCVPILEKYRNLSRNASNPRCSLILTLSPKNPLQYHQNPLHPPVEKVEDV